MTLKHSNPTRPRKDRERREHWARAPYNFVPLPENVVPAQEPLDHDIYHGTNPGLTGWIECELKTRSPTYVRGMLTEAQFKEFGQAKPEELTKEQKKEQAPFFSTSQEKIGAYPEPTIPGSTLRGMVRALVEIVGYGRMRWVAKEPTFTFRAVAASRDDPLRNPYRDVIGSFGRNVKAGYLKEQGDNWYVQPAKTPADMNWPNRHDSFLKVKENQIGSKDIPGFIRFNSPNYRPQLHQVSFSIDIQRGRRGHYVTLNQIGEPGLYEHSGVLVCSGNMLETAQAGQKSPRWNHALVLENTGANEIKIDPQAIEDYKNGLTTFEQSKLTDWSKGNDEPGCLGEGNPVFYVTEGDRVVQFGHCPNFRIVSRQLWGNLVRGSTPHDFVPGDLLHMSKPDLADAIFGWVEERDEKGNIVGPKGQRAGRVFFSDAWFISASDDDVWYKSKPITPHVLSNPKPTTFQHYLVQRNSDRKSDLAHYGRPLDETQIRGHKLYWRKGKNPDIEPTTKERAHESQLTRIVPLKPNVHFTFRIHFENLRPEELGALWWALTLPGNSDSNYCHQLGMGKSFGMGSVKIEPHLVLTDRKARYSRLFAKGANTWEIAATSADEANERSYLAAFETYLANHGIISTEQQLIEVERIRELLTVIEWREEDPNWASWTRYMEIEHGPDKVNEYRERPVLPTPRGVVAMAAGQILSRTQSYQSTRPRQPSSHIYPQRESTSQPVKIQARSVSGIPQVWDLVRGTVYFIDNNGDVYLELDGVPENILGRIAATRLAGKQYQEGSAVTCIVINVLEGDDETLIECEPPSVSELHGEVKSFGLGKSKLFGFIQPDEPDDAQEIFVHRSQLKGTRTLREGQRVRFKIGKGMRGSEAKEVRLES